MKKLMILAAIATVAISSQAANWRWEISSSNPMYKYGTQTAATEALQSGGLAYIFAYTATAQSEVFNQWYNEGKYGVTALTGGLNTKTVSAGVVSVSDSYEFQTTGSGNKFFYALIDSDGHLFISGTKTAPVAENLAGSLLTISAKTPSLRDNGAATAFGSTGWYKQASGDVPEPTSAMLMLLGVAGLALRRRRA